MRAKDKSLFSLWLKETLLLVFVVGSLHITSHIGHVLRILRGADCAHVARKSASGNIYTHIFLKSTKCCKL